MDRVVGSRKGSWTALALAAALALGASTAPANAQTSSYSIIELAGVPKGINNNGQIAGWLPADGSTLPRAAIYGNGVWRDLGVPTDDQYSALFGINNAGAAVGHAFGALPPPPEPADNRWRAIWAPAGATAVEPLIAIPPDSFANAINDSGAIVGCRNQYLDSPPDPDQAYLYANGTLTDLHALLATQPNDITCAQDVNNAGVVVGNFQPNGMSPRGFLYRNGAVTLLAQGLTAYLTNAKAVSNAGKIVGEGQLAGFTGLHALAYDVATGAITSLGLPATGAYSSVANDVNGSGDVVGKMVLGVGDHAFLVSGGQVFDLNDLLPAGTDWVLEEAVSINDSGQIVGRGYLTSDPNTPAYFLMQATEGADSIEDLIAQVRALQAGGFLSKGNANLLVAELTVADRHSRGRCNRLAVIAMEIFVKHVDTLIRTGRLSPTKGQPLIAEANRIIDDLLANSHNPPKPPKHAKKKCFHPKGHGKHRC